MAGEFILQHIDRMLQQTANTAENYASFAGQAANVAAGLAKGLADVELVFELTPPNLSELNVIKGQIVSKTEEIVTFIKGSLDEIRDITNDAEEQATIIQGRMDILIEAINDLNTDVISTGFLDQLVSDANKAADTALAELAAYKLYLDTIDDPDFVEELRIKRDNIWKDATSLAEETYQKQSRDAADTLAARGFGLPPGVYASMLLEGKRDERKRLNEILRAEVISEVDITIRLFEFLTKLKFEGVKGLPELTLRIGELRVNAVGGAVKIKADIIKMTAETQIAAVTAMKEVIGAMIELVRLRMEPVLRGSEVIVKTLSVSVDALTQAVNTAKIAIDAEIEVQKTALDLAKSQATIDVTKISEAVKGLISAAEVYGHVASSAFSALNAIAAAEATVEVEG